MNLLWFDRIGVRLGLAMAGVLTLLALVTSGLANVAFERSARSVDAASALELKSLTRDGLTQVTEREARLINHELERYAAATRTAAEYLGWQIANPVETLEPSTLVQVSSGHWIDPNPDRRSMLYVPRDRAARPSVFVDARASAVLDDLFPGIRSELEDAVGIYFVSPDGLIRYHPPIDIHLLVDPDFDVTVQPVYGLGTPTANPNRRTRWTSPYLDDAGNGLLVTAVTPVYAHGAFRGVLDIDVSLQRLATQLSELTPLPGSVSFLLDDRGHLIASAPGAMRYLGLVCDLTDGPCLNRPEFDGLLDLLRTGRSGVVPLTDRDDPLVLASAPVEETGWTLFVAVPTSVLDAAAHQITAGIADEAALARRAIAAITLLAFVLAAAILTVATQRWVSRPIAALAEGTTALSTGAFTVELPANPRGEFHVLGEALARTSRTLAQQRREILAHQDDLEQRISRRTRELANLVAISADLGSVADPAALIHTVLLRLRDVVPFAHASVWLVEGERLRRLVAVGSGIEDSVAAQVPRTPVAAYVGAPAGRAPRHVAELSHDHALRSLLGSDVDSALLVPIDVRGRNSGVLVMGEPNVQEAHQVDLVAAVSQQVGRVLENTRLLHEARERSALEERQHLARELHDSVSQALFGVVLGLHTARKEIEQRQRLQAAIDYASDLAEAALKEMRALIFELRPEALETEGLAGLLRRQAEALQARHGLQVHVGITEPPLALDAKAMLYRVAQEALHNVVKHAQASRVQVDLELSGGVVRLTVRDDGSGFEAKDRSTEAFGIYSMTERMTLLGGRLDVVSVPDEGTTVTASLALPSTMVTAS